MKTIGLIGGMSWESTALYYRLLNKGVAQRLGGFHSARLLLYSVDFHDVEEHQRLGTWDRAADELAEIAVTLERGGADFFALTTNTMHKVADKISSRVRIPLLHIADATAAAITLAGLERVGLLGTRFTMEEDFYRGRLEAHGLSVIVPDAPSRDVVHRVIYDELCRGDVLEQSRAEFRRIIRTLVERGAQGIILGCTEIGMLVTESDSPVPLFDTTVVHAEAVVELALSE